MDCGKEKSGKLKLLRNDETFLISKFSEGQKNIILFFYFISIFKNYKKSIKSPEESVIVVVDYPHCSLDKIYTYRIADIIFETFITSCEDNKSCNKQKIIS